MVVFEKGKDTANMTVLSVFDILLVVNVYRKKNINTKVKRFCLVTSNISPETVGSI